ncbi:MAG TPA: FAD-dependent oxidoreductase [Opitutaceae bacterium]
MNHVTAKPASPSSTPDCDVAIIGAGPYGLSAGAYLKGRGLGVRVFGEPMEFWAKKMPAGMLLRSPRAASSIGDPGNKASLEAYEAAKGVAPKVRLPIETFVNYGRWFKDQLGSSLDQTWVREVNRDGSRFRLTLQDGQTVTSRRVVVAAGIGPFAKVPEPFKSLPAPNRSHCYEGRQPAEFANKRVVVIGAGQSALESAALLHEAGAQVEVIARISELRWIGRHPILHKLGPISSMLYSKFDVGPAGISRLVSFPNIVRHVPMPLKDKIRKRAVRAAGAQWLKPRLTAVKLTVGHAVRSATYDGKDVTLRLDDGTERHVDHVLMGTGYGVDLSKYGFMPASLTAQVERLEGYPTLATGFESSVPGLHFVGAAAAKTFGPLLYFVAGTDFASKNLAASIGRDRARVPA